VKLKDYIFSMDSKTPALNFKNNNSGIKGRILIGLLIVALVLAAVSAVVLIWVWRALPHIAIVEISELTNSSVEAKSIDFKSDGSVLIKELVISPKQEQKYDDALLKAKTVYARFSIGSLLLLGPRLKEIRINDFVFDAQYDLDTDRWNLEAFKFNVPKNGAGKMPLIVLDGGTLQYSRVSKGRTTVLAAVPIDMRFRPAEETLGGYSFDITTAEKADVGSALRSASPEQVSPRGDKSKLSGLWLPGRITVTGGVSFRHGRSIPALENTWVIDALDAVLNYDQRNNFLLMLKIKDLFYPQELAGDIFTFGKPASAFGGSVLFTALQSFFGRFNPAGNIDLDIEVSGNLGQLSESTINGEVYCKDVNICDRTFPYTVEQMTGQVEFTENSVVLNNLSGKHGDVNVTFTGWIKDFGPNQQYHIQIASDNMALDDDLYNALSAKQKDFWTAFSPSGLATIDYRLSRSGSSAEQTVKEKTLEVELRGVEAVYKHFPYPLKALTGKLYFDRGSITVYDIASQADEGRIAINGKVTEHNTDRSIYYLSIKANDIPFKPKLARTLLTNQNDLYNQFDITGLVDVDAKVFTPTEDTSPTSFHADLTLKEGVLKANKSGLTISDVSAKLNVTPASTSIRSFTGRYGQSPVSLTGGIWLDSRQARSLTDKRQLPQYHLALDVKQAQLSDELIGMLPEPMEQIVSQMQPAGKVNISANLQKNSSDDKANYSISVECLGDSVNYKRFIYPLKDVTGTVTITNNNVTLNDITAIPDFDQLPSGLSLSVEDAQHGLRHSRVADVTQKTKDSSIKLNGQIALADNVFSEGVFQLSAKDISFSEHLASALPPLLSSTRRRGGAFYRALSPSGRFDLDLVNIKIYKDDGGQKYIDFTAFAELKGCNFNISGTQAELDAVIKTKGLYKTGIGLSNGQVRLLADNLKIKGKSITNLKSELNYNPSLRHWSAENLVADCYGGQLIGKLEIKPAGDALEYTLQAGFGNIDLKQFLLGEEPARLRQAKTSDTSGIMEGSLSIGAQMGDSSSRIGRCRFSIRNMQVGKLSPLAKLLNVFSSFAAAPLRRTKRPTEPKNYAFEQMVVDSYIRSDTLLFDEFDLSGETVAFHGSGRMNLKSENVNLTLTARGKRLAGAEPSFLESLTEGLGKAVVRMEVTGNVYDPQVETKTLPVVEDSLKILGTTR